MLVISKEKNDMIDQIELRPLQERFDNYKFRAFHANHVVEIDGFKAALPYQRVALGWRIADAAISGLAGCRT